MRWSQRTLILLAAAVLVIVGVAILNNNQASAPNAQTATPGASAALIPVEASAVRRVEIVSNADGSSTILSADENGTWRISASNPTDRAPDQERITTQIGNLVALQGENPFEVAESELGNFGLAAPANVIRVTAAGTQYTLYIGGSNPAGNRFYVVLETSPAPEAESTPEAEATLEAESTAEAEAAPEAESTPEAEATPEAEFTAEAAAPTPTLLVVPPQPTVTLSGTRTIYLVARGTINTFIDFVASPPYVPPPTATPTPTATLNPLSEVQIATLTAEAIATQQAAATATAQAAEATAEATPEAASGS